MTDQIFPSWWGPEGGAPVLCRSAREVGAGWVRHQGHYDAQIGQWVPARPRAAPRRARLPTLARKSRAALVAIAAAEGARHRSRAPRKQIIAAIRASREEG